MCDILCVCVMYVLCMMYVWCVCVRVKTHTEDIRYGFLKGVISELTPVGSGGVTLERVIDLKLWKRCKGPVGREGGKRGRQRERERENKFSLKLSSEDKLPQFLGHTGPKVLWEEQHQGRIG